jgi:hypothetical protein
LRREKGLRSILGGSPCGLVGDRSLGLLSVTCIRVRDRGRGAGGGGE